MLCPPNGTIDSRALNRPDMNITLSSYLENLVQQKVSSGEYSSVEAMIEAALRLLEERDRQVQRLRSELMIGVEQIQIGAVHDGPEALKQLREKAERYRQSA